MKDRVDQHAAQSPPASSTRPRHAGHNGGKAKLRTCPSTPRTRLAAREHRSSSASGMFTGRILRDYLGPDAEASILVVCKQAMSAPLVFDRSLVRRYRRRAAALGPATFLIDRVAEDFTERLSAILRRFALVADLGSPTGAVRRALANQANVGTVIAVDAQPRDPVSDAALMVVADEEVLPFAESMFDLVVSALALQSVNDLPGVLIQ